VTHSGNRDVPNEAYRNLRAINRNGQDIAR